MYIYIETTKTKWIKQRNIFIKTSTRKYIDIYLRSIYTRVFVVVDT